MCIRDSVNAVPSNITEAFSTNNSILAVVVVAIIIGLCMYQLGEKADSLKKVLESANEVIQMLSLIHIYGKW